jgi:uncharacterized protein YdaU (DUF1376 family)
MTSLSFIAFHMRDYQRDTQQLPLEGHGAYFLLLQHCWTHGRIPADDASRAAICKVTVQRWRRHLAPLVAGYFNADGENKRANVEIAKAEKLRLRQAMAGHNGGAAAQKRKAERVATAQPRPSGGQAMAKPRSSHGEAIKREDITTNLSVAARARGETAENPEISTAAATPQESGLAMDDNADTDARVTELQAVMIRKGWVKP